MMRPGPMGAAGGSHHDEQEMRKINEGSLKNNIYQLGKMRTYSALSSGVCAGALGLGMLNGVLFYFIMFFITSAVIAAKLEFKIEAYFLKSGMAISDGMGKDLLLYIVVWTIFHNLVNIL
mmetsp:Transcript_5530/g.5958  ORF Transcript_5530/g.5958 Transcript_5530/m.5958 type:complete len:120 (+) Transcript_5530:44-403(+)|eukprot:CAMPEP_0176413748 /NCGR_PEP_ID=MMETSP0127-20121128/4872_1 /TAXON_ID=938130 /ORGANISM="Platyophrya macrostoma, Strain WH" /LENGTH=119 /DNA_ID=CAMNT_0017793565 /DNA_START=34 /DNA_END=393 /DNA_ORIENTATION=-